MKKRCHFIGIGGIGMSGLARILVERGWEVTGSDLAKSAVTEGLEKVGAKVFVGHRSEYVSAGGTVVYSTDIGKENPEFLAARELGCTILHRSEMLLQLMGKGLAVTGTHGKTTTSALLTAVLVEGGLDPSYAVGGVIPQLQSNARNGKGEYFVAEADESDGTFLRYHPYGAIVTNIDNDHMNYFETEERLERAFGDFMGQVVSKEHLFWCGEDERLEKLSVGGKSYGFGEKCDVRASRVVQSGWKSVFDVHFGGRVYEKVEVALIGRHNVLNALAVFGLALSVGVDEKAIRQAFRSFGGVLRRCEKKGEVHGILFLDDYAHHPTEIQTTLRGIREAVEERRLVVVYQPHRYTRTRDCVGMFGGIFSEADELFVTEVYGAGEAPIAGVSHQIVMDEVQKNAKFVERKELAAVLAEQLRPHDVVVTLGAGDITKLGLEVMARMNGVKKWRVGVIEGGRSAEHEISLLSAKHVKGALSSEFYDVVSFMISKEGKWSCGEYEDRVFPRAVMEQLESCDVLFPILHGPFGEDGTIQGFFDMLGKPYVGCDHRASAIAMDKALTKDLIVLNGIATSPYLSITESEWKEHSKELHARIMKELKMPVYVKPVHLGSSVGVCKVENEFQLDGIIKNAFHYDTKVIVENGIKGREIEFAVLGNDRITVFPPGEIFTQGGIYDYAAKYGVNGMSTTSQAGLSEELIQEGMELAKAAFRVTGCSGMARIDFFLDDNGKYWLNEINPIPGFTNISLYPQVCAKNGLDSAALIDRLIVLALHRKRMCKNYETVKR